MRTYPNFVAAVKALSATLVASAAFVIGCSSTSSDSIARSHQPLISANGTITMSAEDSPQLRRVTVANEGEPIDPALIERIFDRFYRADPARKSDPGSAGSTGLGLAIVRTIMELLGLDSHRLEVPGRQRLAIDHGMPIREIIA